MSLFEAVCFEVCSRMFMYRRSLRASTFSIILYTVIWFIAACVAYDSSTMHSPCHWMQILVSELRRRMSRPVGNSAIMFPIVSALGESHSEFLALKSPNH